MDLTNFLLPGGSQSFIRRSSGNWPTTGPYKIYIYIYIIEVEKTRKGIGADRRSVEERTNPVLYSTSSLTCDRYLVVFPSVRDTRSRDRNVREIREMTVQCVPKPRAVIPCRWSSPRPVRSRCLWSPLIAVVFRAPEDSRTRFPPRPGQLHIARADRSITIAQLRYLHRTRALRSIPLKRIRECLIHIRRCRTFTEYII